MSDQRAEAFRDQRAAEVERSLADALRQIADLTAQVNFLTQADEGTQNAIAGLKKGGVRESAMRPSETQLWLCGKCGSRAGVYDPHDDELALRMKEFVVHLQLGLGGWVSTTCRGCSFPVRLDYELPADLSAEERSLVEAAQDLLAAKAEQARARRPR